MIGEHSRVHAGSSSPRRASCSTHRSIIRRHWPTSSRSRFPESPTMRIIALLRDDGTLGWGWSAHRDTAQEPIVARLRSYVPDLTTNNHPWAEVVHSGRTQIVETVTDEYLRSIATDDTHLSLLRDLAPTRTSSSRWRRADECLDRCFLRLTVIRADATLIATWLSLPRSADGSRSPSTMPRCIGKQSRPPTRVKTWLPSSHTT